jgi:hypothetical protein
MQVADPSRHSDGSPKWQVGQVSTPGWLQVWHRCASAGSRQCFTSGLRRTVCIGPIRVAIPLCAEPTGSSYSWHWPDRQANTHSSSGSRRKQRGHFVMIMRLRSARVRR